MGLMETLRRGGSEKQLREELQRASWQVEHLSESMASLERQLVDDGWRRLTTQMDREFTRSGLDDLMRMSRAMYLAHPLIQRAVNVRAYYTWAQGVHIQAEDDRVQEVVIDPLLTDPRNKKAAFGHQARILCDVDQQVDGNTFTALFTGPTGAVSVRSIPAEDVTEIICDPGDKENVWFYRRCWYEQRLDLSTGLVSPEAREMLYPDVTFALASLGSRDRPPMVGRVPVMWDAPVVHQKTGGLKGMLFGFPETYAALDWARAYQKFLEDWHTIVASLARFAWRMTTKGSKVKQAKTRLASTVTPDSPVEENRAPAAGSAFIGTDGDNIVPINKSGATTSAEDAKPSRLMVAAAMDLPDTILSGDADQGTLATAKSLDRPTELAIRSRQQMWMDRDQEIFGYVVAMAQLRGGLGQVEDTTVNVSFPSVVEHDMDSVVKAIVTAATLNGQLDAGTIPAEQLSRMLLQALGVENVEAILDDLEAEDAHADLDALPPDQREAVRELVHRLGDLITT